MLEISDLSWLALLRRILSASCMAWLGIKFGRTLRAGRTPLIEQIARVSNPTIPPEICLYARLLTAGWCAYFLIAALFFCFSELAFPWTGLLVISCSLTFFIGEYWLRPRLFLDQQFPSMLRQLRDIWSVWRQDSLLKNS